MTLLIYSIVKLTPLRDKHGRSKEDRELECCTMMSLRDLEITEEEALWPGLVWNSPVWVLVYLQIRTGSFGWRRLRTRRRRFGFFGQVLQHYTPLHWEAPAETGHVVSLISLEHCSAEPSICPSGLFIRQNSKTGHMGGCHKSNCISLFLSTLRKTQFYELVLSRMKSCATHRFSISTTTRP